MNDGENKTQNIERYMSLQRILAAGSENWEVETKNQLREVKSKLETLGVAVENLTIDKYQ